MKVVFLVLLLLLAVKFSYPLPLSTKSRWVVNDLTGERVKFKCVNWPAHLEPMLAEGLDKRPLSLIAKHVGLLGFNCVRLSYATHMFTRYSNKTVVQSFRDLKLTNAINGLQMNNPQVLNLTLVDALSKVIDVIVSYGVMVVLDNHISRPMWCCSNDDGNGFFGDKDFDPREWLNGWTIVGARYRNTPMVVAMSLRNELRGRRQNVNEWYRWVRQGVTTIHKANPNVLIIVSGLNYDLDFSYLKSKPLGLENVLPNKIVYETHMYSFSDGQAKWLHRPLNQNCDSVIRDINKRVGFVTTGPHPAPLFISEFGVNLMGTNRADNYFLTCYMAYLAESDLDWALWALQGSYYLRQGVQNTDEQYGLLDTNWTQLRNPDFNRKLYLIHQTLQVPKLTSSNYTFMYHPLTGRCIEYDNKNQIFADECDKLTRLSHVGDWNPIQLATTPLCIMMGGEGLPVKLTTDCYAEQSTWRSISRFQIASKDVNGTDLCLDYDPNSSSKILSKKCVCRGKYASKCLNNPQSQWFKFVSTNSRLF
ncbi:ricin B, lectin domain, Glycoside hydrolase [Artemisia annua]|uniref:Ricin B, lectin domain, Glycoside hydrolase n=1 Tax=Artemisia annua TaxID=35608 RepID=A0A2U1P7Q9_ARTAN|nr:ricin B, lectin domain, Glycoside hydrolase [Artemisia annua]